MPIVLMCVFLWLYLNVFPGISGYGAKNLCSAIYLQHRESSDVIQEDLSHFPVSLGAFTWDSEDASTTGFVWGLAGRKAIYRKECGCTLVNDFEEATIRAQKIVIPKPPTINKDSILWPVGDFVEQQALPNVDYQQLNTAIKDVMREQSENGHFADTRAVLVLFDGKIVAEHYADGYDKNTVMLGWSMSKTLTAAMVGILVKQGKLSVDDQAPVPEWSDNEKGAITIKHLLQQTSGIDFVENYARPSNVIQMLFSEGDMAAYSAGLKLIHEPGTSFNYSSGNTNILSRIIRDQVDEDDYASFPFEELFYKINAYSFLLEPDASGTYVGSAYSYATARDFARVGLLYYNNGAWNGEQILPVNWVTESTTPSSADKLKQHGYQLWLNGYDKENPNQRKFPDVPQDMYYIDGYGGQRVFIIPSKKLVVVRMGLFEIDANAFLKKVLECFDEVG
ncbi:serine hydrolase [Marinoscillum sp. MHG1-6]|uniref:serine hydrolase domain-containing protein n=1 Tax=Marinoscillum sp. MHG1-6 TaxID=2959627 RepID=UPI002157C3FE|nr:serine hydrolase [Marinoscillum sp. MHG1-6]